MRTRATASASLALRSVRRGTPQTVRVTLPRYPRQGPPTQKTGPLHGHAGLSHVFGVNTVSADATHVCVYSRPPRGAQDCLDLCRPRRNRPDPCQPCCGLSQCGHSAEPGRAERDTPPSTAQGRQLLISRPRRCTSDRPAVVPCAGTSQVASARHLASSPTVARAGAGCASFSIRGCGESRFTVPPSVTSTAVPRLRTCARTD